VCIAVKRLAGSGGQAPSCPGMTVESKNQNISWKHHVAIFHFRKTLPTLTKVAHFFKYSSPHTISVTHYKCLQHFPLNGSNNDPTLQVHTEAILGL
jgi:hypothetical protein